jgi:hypothetical protein
MEAYRVEIFVTPFDCIFYISKHHHHHQRKIADTFIEKELEYILIDEKHLVGNLLCVYAKASLEPYIKGIRGAVTPVGVMGMMGNKGAVILRMTVHNTSLCFVCSHLSANRDNVVGRNNDFKNINDKTLLYPCLNLSKSTSIAGIYKYTYIYIRICIYIYVCIYVKNFIVSLFNKSH